ncbi:MAG: hypothetical protein QXI12_07405 [Candidatus Methanomethyliaceae archaeon]
MNRKKKSLTWQDGLDEVSFDQGGPEKRLKYRCRRCGCSEWVPAWVIDEFAMGEKRRHGKVPETCCPVCPGAMAYTGESADM